MKRGNDSFSSFNSSSHYGNVPFSESRIDFQYFYDDIVEEIFSFLNVSDFYNVSQVCSQWNRVASRNKLWKRLYEFHWREKPEL